MINKIKEDLKGQVIEVTIPQDAETISRTIDRIIGEYFIQFYLEVSFYTQEAEDTEIIEPNMVDVDDVIIWDLDGNCLDSHKGELDELINGMIKFK